MEKNPTRAPRNRQDLSFNQHGQNKTPIPVRPYIVGYMSVDASRNYRSDLSQLKFVTHIPRGNLSWDLNHNIHQAVKRTAEDSDEKIDLLLKFLLDQNDRFNLPPNTFITYRSTLINVLYSAFNISEPLCIRACLYKNHIYLDKIKSALEIQRRKSRSEQEKTYCAWGYKFEQYMSSDHPALAPNIEKPVVGNEAFSLYFCSQIGDHKLFYGAHVDGLLATSPVAPPPDTADVRETLSYLRQHHYVELLTNKEILTPRQEKSFKYKMLKCWYQCYLANYKGLLVGFRNEHGVVQRLQWFDTAQIAEYCKHEWDPQRAFNFINYFLTFVKNSFSSYNASNTNSSKTLDFYIDMNRTIKIVEHDHEDQATLLPDWYIGATK